MKKIVRNNKTFMVNEELYQQIRKNAAYLMEDEQLSLPGFGDSENKKTKEKTKKELEKEKKIKKRAFDLLYDSYFKAKCLQVYSEYRKLLINNSNIFNVPEELKGLNVKEFFKEVTDSRKLFNRFVTRIVDNRTKEKEKIHSKVIFFDEVAKLLKDKKFILSTVQKTLQSMKQPMLNVDADTSNNTNQNINTSSVNNTVNSNLSANPMSESLLYEDNKIETQNQTAEKLTKGMINFSKDAVEKLQQIPSEESED